MNSMVTNVPLTICHLTITNQNAIPRLLREANSAISGGYKCCIVAPGNNSSNNGVEIIGVSLPCCRLNRIIKTDREVFDKALSFNADIYQIHDPELLRFAIKLKKAGKTVIFDSHEFYGLQIREKKYIPILFRGFAAHMYMAYEKYVCKRIDAVLYVCTINGKNYFQDRATRSIELPNYPEIGFFRIPFNIKKTRESESEYIIYAGLLSPDRGITNLAEAAKQTGIKLRLCGAFESSQYEKFLKSEYGDTIDYRGVLSQNDLAKEYYGASAGMSTILPIGQYGVADTYPTKLLEYCWMGIPVIVSDFPFLRSFVEKNNCGICVKPDDVSAIGCAIKYLHDHQKEAHEMGQNGRHAVEKELNWGTQRVKLLDLYKELLNNE